MLRKSYNTIGQQLEHGKKWMFAFLLLCECGYDCCFFFFNRIFRPNPIAIHSFRRTTTDHRNGMNANDRNEIKKLNFLFFFRRGIFSHSSSFPLGIVGNCLFAHTATHTGHWCLTSHPELGIVSYMQKILNNWIWNARYLFLHRNSALVTLPLPQDTAHGTQDIPNQLLLHNYAPPYRENSYVIKMLKRNGTEQKCIINLPIPNRAFFFLSSPMSSLASFDSHKTCAFTSLH